ncbi:MAG: hypothetical protein ACMV1B_05935 [Prevotella sp.]
MSLLSDIGTAIKNKLGGTSVDNTVPRYDGTTCKLQGSGVTISDTNTVTASGGFVGNLTGTATLASDSNKLIGKNWAWAGQLGQPAWVWGGSDGTNMYVYNPANFTVSYATNALGYNQSWQDVTASRALGTTYTNSTGKPIVISVAIFWYNNNAVYDYITVNGVVVAKNGTDNTSTTTTINQLTAIVPNGSTYSVTALKPFKHWAELR